MRVRDVMTENPIYCNPGDSVQSAAKILCDRDIGILPVLTDDDSQSLVGIITDRDLCCRIVAKGLDPSGTRIETVMQRQPVSCRPEQSLDSCEKLMQLHQLRRLPVVDHNSHCVGMVSQADLARSERADKLHRTVAEISKPTRTLILAMAVVSEVPQEDVMEETKKDSEGADQNRSKETSEDKRLAQIADEAARKGLESEKRFDEEHSIFTE